MPIERALGRVLINSLLPSGMGANAIIRVIKRQGLSYRRQDMLSDIRRFSGRFKHEGSIISMGDNEVISRFRMVETDIKRPYKYRVFGDARYFDPETGDYSVETRSFYTDDLASKSKWEDDFVSFYKESYPELKGELMSFNMKSVEHNYTMGY